ncbi:uncharacterized protein NECHADRAFT_96887 [Fusarium vanettenii 77-13-4]|uniref:Zn(2)-C6 fungal-type domain-containing protein n=1 Tax=Fusarium vanettenii (strain ATCC MYA-4622 / CBS 123669 / FGSC 9596 / NRRL 45880 / 77-13-4) TaxID=660122 RepID=C7Z1T6_FUSV7|nr:uncharacterized protein NECHADRAFT_96887 [Fusarium vanettenii 77-13-4]EEU41880.1 predicted protein [Fusarium vanettenii 77-13-4]
MVNRGRSGGCVTCKERRVKCDEAKPECRSCQRLKLRCGGYNRPKPKPKYAKLRFRDQNYKFCTNTNQDVDSNDRDVVKVATSPSQSSESDVQHRQVARALTSRRPSEPDTAVPFFLGHYARIGRDMGSTRGFFEMLIPAYFSQQQESALSLAVSALASEILSMWRGDTNSFRLPQGSYSRAITRLRTAIQDPTERAMPATMLAILVLQTYENASAVYDLRRASRMHHNGAASLLSFVDTDAMDGTVRAYLRKFMLHTEVSTAMRQKKPLKSIAYSWIGSKDAMAVPDNPSSALDAIGASVAELQASYTQFVTQGGSTTSLEHVLTEWRAEARRVDAELLAWAANVPDHWRPSRLISGRDIDSSIPTYQSICEVYPSCQIASIWNLWRFQRLVLAKITLGCLGAFSGLGRFGFAYGQFLDDPADFVNCQQRLQEVVDSVCYSIPFHLGNRTTRSTLMDFTDPTILLPSQGSLNGVTSNDDHRRHVIAQGPWRAMHPLSRCLTLFSEDDGEVIASLLRPGQREWIRDQFLRVATLLHLPTEPGNYMEGSGSPGGSADVKAEYLAREIRKGAILMSGP